MDEQFLYIGSGELARSVSSRKNWLVLSFDEAISSWQIYKGYLAQFQAVVFGYDPTVDGRRASHVDLLRSGSFDQTFVLLSSRKVYRRPYGALETDSRITRGSSYALRKVEEENLFFALRGHKRSLTLRLPNIISDKYSESDAKFFAEFMRQYCGKNNITFSYEKDVEKDFISSRDLFIIIEALIKADCSGVYNVGYGYPVKIQNFVQLFFQIFPECDVFYNSGAEESFFLRTDKLTDTILGSRLSLHGLLDTFTQIGG